MSLDEGGMAGRLFPREFMLWSERCGRKMSVGYSEFSHGQIRQFIEV